MEYILVAYIYAGMLSKGDSVALTRIDAYPTVAACEDAAKSLTPLTASSFKEIRHVCVPHQTK